MKVYVIRHGQSETNKSGHYTGQSQVSLTEKGFDDARGIRPLLSAVNFDKVYASDLVRARQTAETALPGVTYELSKLLRETDVGSLEMTAYKDVSVETKKVLAAEGYSMFGGESRDQLTARVTGFMRYLEENHAESDTVAIFTHAGWMRSIFRAVLGVEPRSGSLKCDNCTVAVFEFKRSDWSLHSWINPN